MSNIDPKIASHASMWLKNAEQIERQLGRLTSDELEAYRYVRDIFKQPRPDMERLQVAQERLRDVGSELHDDFGAAVKNFAAKVSVIIRNFEVFRQTVVNGFRSTDIALASPETEPAEPASATDRQVRIEGNNQSYYCGCVDENGLPHGMGELHYGFDSYSDHHISVTGNFCHGKFPEQGLVSDGRCVFNGDFHVGLDESYNVIDFIKYFRSADISLKEGNLTVDGCTIEGKFRFSYGKISLIDLTSVRFKTGEFFKLADNSKKIGLLYETTGEPHDVFFNLSSLTDCNDLSEAVRNFADQVAATIRSYEEARKPKAAEEVAHDDPEPEEEIEIQLDEVLAIERIQQNLESLEKVRIEGNNQSYYCGCVDENGLPHGMGELHYGFDSYSDCHISVTGNFCHGKFPEQGLVSDGRCVFNGDFHVGLDESYNVVDFIRYFRSTGINLGNGCLTVNGCVLNGTFRLSGNKVSIKNLTSVRFKNGKIFEKDNSANDTGILKDTSGKSKPVSFNLRLLTDSDNLISEFKPIQ